MKGSMRYVGLDVHAETIVVAVVDSDGEEKNLGVIANRPDSIRKCMRKLGKPEELRCCYEAGPTGYVLYWQLVQMGIEQFNRQQFFTCHETLEDAWNAESRPLRILYQGILQIAVGYFHITRQNWRGAVKVLERGIPKAAHFRPGCQGIDVDDLVLRAQEIQTRLLEIGPDDPDTLAQIRFPRINVE